MKLIRQLVLVSIAALLAFMALVYFYDTQPPVEQADAAIVLGAVVWGNEPSPVFRERINHGISLYHAGAVRKLVFTGGTGDGMRFAESEIATEYAVSRGVPMRDILAENTSRTTYENLEAVQPLLDEHRLDTLLIVSDPLHLRRAVAMAEGMGMVAYPSATRTTRYRSLDSKLPFLLREALLYAGYLLGMRVEKPTSPGHIRPASTFSR